jgi:hypothetical protein
VPAARLNAGLCCTCPEGACLRACPLCPKFP